MTDTQYVKKITALYDELKDASLSEPFDAGVFNEVHARIMALHFCWLTSRRRRPWAALVSCIFLMIILLWIVYSVLCALYTGGSQ